MEKNPKEVDKIYKDFFVDTYTKGVERMSLIQPDMETYIHNANFDNAINNDYFDEF